MVIAPVACTLRIGVPLRAGQHDQLDKMAAGNKDVQRLLR